jgi:hypothetical protein
VIEFLVTLDSEGRPQVQQSLVSPSVYLHTWAIRAFAENGLRGDRFRQALQHVRGTLVLSDLNLLDFTSFDDPRHARGAAAFVDSLMPQVFFLRSDPFQVMNRELEYLVKHIRSSPAGDEDMLSLFAEGTAVRGGRMTTAGWFSSVHEKRKSLRDGAQGLADSLFRGINEIRARMTGEQDFRRAVQQGVETARRPRATLALLRAVVYRLQADHRMPQTANTAIDLLHSIVPSAYCNFVLVDGQWHDLLEDARARLVAAAFDARVAMSFSERGDGVEQFLQTLENWGQAEPPPNSTP